MWSFTVPVSVWEAYELRLLDVSIGTLGLGLGTPGEGLGTLGVLWDSGFRVY